MLLKLAMLCLIFLSPFSGMASTQMDCEVDSVGTETKTSNLSVKSYIVPASLMAYGALEAATHKKGILNFSIGHEVIEHKPDKIPIDDYTQYLPAVSVYALNWAGVKGKHNFKDRTMILGIAAIYMTASVNALKYTAKEKRPDRSENNSFPSGHTATAFMGAEFLYQEYKEVSPWYGIGGYLVAAGTGAFRIYNNKHWLGDVVFGAGLGMLSTKLAYLTYPALQKKIQTKEGGHSEKKKCKEVGLVPYYTGQQGGFSAYVHF